MALAGSRAEESACKVRRYRFFLPTSACARYGMSTVPRIVIRSSSISIRGGGYTSAKGGV